MKQKQVKQAMVVKLTCNDDVKRGTIRGILSAASKMVNEIYHGNFKFSLFEIPKLDKERVDAAIGQDDYETQARIVLKHLQSGKGITSIESFSKWKITRLSAVIFVIQRKMLIPVNSVWEKNETSGKRYKRFFLSAKEKE